MNLSKLQEIEKDGEDWHAAALRISKSKTQPTEQKQIYMAFCKRQNYRKGNRSVVVKVKEVEEVDHKWTVWGIGGIMSVIPDWLRNPMDCSLPDSSVHRILQAVILE